MHDHLITKQNSPGTLSQYLEKEVVFGRKAMEQCTPSGSKRYRALPQRSTSESVQLLVQSYNTNIYCMYGVYGNYGMW